MALIFLSILLALYTHTILCYILPEIKFESLEAEHLPPEEANLDAKILVQSLLYLSLYLPSPQIQCDLLVFLTLVLDRL